MEKKHNQFLLDLQRQKQGEHAIVSYGAKLKVVGSYDDATLLQFGALLNCFFYFNECLFNNSLSSVFLTLNRKAHSMGYYKPCGWLIGATQIIPEINVNPAILHLPEIEVMQTLVHEMAHHAQYLFGMPGKRGYHNKEFARLMFSVGLMCSSTGLPGGKITGRSMADYPVEGGVFIQAFNTMPKAFLLPFKPADPTVLAVSMPIETTAINTETKDKSKTKYSCLPCDVNVWGKPNLNIICGNCGQHLK